MKPKRSQIRFWRMQLQPLTQPTLRLKAGFTTGSSGIVGVKIALT